jgi:hypothetical protein
MSNLRASRAPCTDETAGRGPAVPAQQLPEQPDERMHVALDFDIDAALAIVVLAG